ncbi:MAG: EAL domain-containing protein [Pseudomonadota bacterium]|nr:EAL domain-containing protein [Pseudomonadota bacterium]
MSRASDSRSQRLRLGLTWRVVTLTSLLLVALAVLFTYLSYTNLTRQFTASRQEQIERQQRELEFAIRRSENGLQQLAGLIAASPDLGPALRRPTLPSSAAELSPDLASLWPSLQLEAGVERMLVYDDQAGQVMALGGEPDQQAPSRYTRWMATVMREERPLSPLECAPQCRQYAVVPVLADGGSSGALLLSRSLADVTRQTRDISTSEVALISLVASDDQGPGNQAERQLPDWQGRVQAVTNAPHSLALLRQASRKRSLEDLARTPLRMQQDGRHLELSAVPLTSSSGTRAPAYFVLMSDITTQIHAIQLDTRTQMIASLFGWLSAELLLLAILLRPMARLRRVASVLPLLARGGFSQARDALPLAPRRLPDEIDVLEASTLTLADHLERLQQQVSQRGEELARRIEELARERDFISSLIDTAQVYILTQDEEGRIDMINAYLEQQLSCPSRELLGRRFDDIFDAALEATTPGSSRLQEERTLTLPDGELRTIIWYHSPLLGRDSTSLARISVGLDITERKAAESRLTWLAERDPLTELYNRRFFLESLRRALSRGEHGAVMLLDLDQFKEVNELSGHHAGDRMLHTVARLLQQEYAHRGVIARLGGDEFALLLNGVDEDHAIRIAQHLNQLFESLGFVAEGRRHRITASIGIVPFPTEGATPADLMASADVAMYKAKASNLQRWHLLATLENARDELNERVYWVDRIRRALVDGDFVLMVQPIVKLEDRSIRHYEVLLRLRDDDGSLISPARFIPVAEHSGQIVAIDRWVLHHCVHALARLDGISLAVNLSGQSLHDEGLKQFLADLLETSQADPHHLVLEVTETAAVTDFSTARGVLQSVRDLGCRTALDDFGVGFSSFHYLGQLPVDYIKIDGSFIRSLATSPDSRVIVKAVSDIATGFGKQAVAEFVDQEALIPLLSSYNIAYGQGYHLGRPVPFEEVFDFNPVNNTHHGK